MWNAFFLNKKRKKQQQNVTNLPIVYADLPSDTVEKQRPNRKGSSCQPFCEFRLSLLFIYLFRFESKLNTVVAYSLTLIKILVRQSDVCECKECTWVHVKAIVRFAIIKINCVAKTAVKCKRIYNVEKSTCKMLKLLLIYLFWASLFCVFLACVLCWSSVEQIISMKIKDSDNYSPASLLDIPPCDKWTLNCFCEVKQTIKSQNRARASD